MMATTTGTSRLGDTVGRGVRRGWNLTRHVLRIDRAEMGQSPRDLVWSRDKVTLWRYRSQQRSLQPPLLLVHSLVSRSYVFDLQPGNSFVEQLLAEGFDVFLLDWGVPDEAEAHNSLETYVDDYIPAAVSVVDRLGSGHGVTVFGYCFGGLLAVLYAAGHPSDPVRNLLVMATPADFGQMPQAMRGVGSGKVDPEDLIDDTGNLPAATVRSSFQLLRPTADLATYADFWENLHDDGFLTTYQAMTTWSREHIPFPGDAFRQSVALGDSNALARNDVHLGGRHVDLRNITVPFLNVIAERDHIVPPPATEVLTGLVGSADASELRLPAGHVGLIVGGGARRRSIPAMAAWMAEHSVAADGTSTEAHP
jgi:polyhydroxyalkanoate synthase subunit PhaC